MGYPINPENNPVGDDCVNAFGNGTPEIIYCTISGMTTGDLWGPGDSDPPNRQFTLTQDAVTPCLWIFDDATWNIQILQTILGELMVMTYKPPVGDIFNSLLVGHNWFYTNTVGGPAGRFFWQGTAKVAWLVEDSPSFLDDIIDGLNVSRINEYQAMTWPIDADFSMAHLTDLGDNTKCLVKYEH